ncbi:MAG TPA: DNA ligase D, partial [Polyangiaceae bacterium]
EDAPKSAATGRTMDQIAKSSATWQSNRGGNGKGTKNGNGKKTSAPPRTAARLKTLRKTAASSKDPMPATVEVELAQLVKEAPAGDGWLHEVKLDGYRIIARRSGKNVALITRGGKDWTERMPVVRDAVLALPLPLPTSVILDGEVVVLDSRGISNFQLLQNSLGDGNANALVYVVFDLLYLNGKDIRHVPLAQRKELLEKLLEGEASDHIRLSEHVETSGAAFFAEACKRKLEGIVSKRASEPYRGGRGHGWVKTKCLGRQEFVIGGYTNPGGSRSHLGALLVGVPEPKAKGKLRYAGKVGTGFTERSLKELKSRLSRMAQATPSFTNPPRGAAARAAHWVKPTLLAEIEFTEVTNDGLLRHPTFRGLREDKPAREVKMEKPAPEPSRSGNPKAAKTANGAKVANGAKAENDFRLTNPDKVLYPESGYTKADIAKYYATIAGHMFPHLEDRPLTLVRCPEGRGRACFFQKHAPADIGPGLHGFPIDDEGKELYIAMESPMGLLSLTQLGVLEIHTWGSHTQTLEKPDLLVFDLDPDPTVEWAKVVHTAKALKTRLEPLELKSWVKTTGGKGLHVCVPIRPRLGW